MLTVLFGKNGINLPENVLDQERKWQQKVTRTTVT